MAAVMVGTRTLSRVHAEEPECIAHELLILRYASVLKCSHVARRTGVI